MVVVSGGFGGFLMGFDGWHGGGMVVPIVVVVVVAGRCLVG